MMIDKWPSYVSKTSRDEFAAVIEINGHYIEDPHGQILCN